MEGWDGMDGMDGWDGSPGGPRYRAPTVLIMKHEEKIVITHCIGEDD